MNVGDIIFRLLSDDSTFKKNVVKSGEQAGDDAAKTFGQRFKAGAGTAGKAVAVTLGASLSGLAIVGAKGFAELDDAMHRFQADTGATDEELKKATDTTNALFGKTRASYSEIADVLGKLRTDIGLSQDAADKAALSYLNFAKVAGETGTEAVGQFDDILDAFNLDASKAPGIMDQLTASHQKYGGSISENAKALSELAPQLQGLNLGVDDGIALLNVFAASGIDASKATFALNTAVQKLKPGQSLDDVIAKLSAIEDPAKRARAAVDFFGARGGVALAQALRPGMTSLADFGVSAQDAAGATQKASDTIDSSWNNRIALWIKSIGAFSTGILKDFGPPIAGIGPLIALIGPNFGSIIKLTKAWGKQIIAIIPKLLAQGVAIAASLGPIGLLIGAVGLLAVAWQTNFLGIRDAVGNVANDMALNFGDMGDTVHEAADEMGVSFDKMKTEIAKGMDEMGLSFEQAVARAKRVLAPLPEALPQEEIVARAKATGAMVAAGLHGSLAGASAQVEAAARKGITQPLSQEMQAAVDATMKKAVTVPGGVAVTLDNGTRIVASSSESLAQLLPAAMRRAKDDTVDIAEEVPQDITDALIFSKDQIKQWKDQLKESLVDPVSDARALMLTAGVLASEGVAEGLDKGSSSLNVSTLKMMEDQLSTIEAYVPDFIETGKGIPKAQAKGVTENLGLAVDAIERLRDAQKPGMDLAAFAESQGFNNLAGYIRGIRSQRAAVAAAAGQAAVAAQKRMDLDLTSSGAAVGKSWIDGMIAAIRRGGSGIGSAARDATSDLRGKSPPKTGPLMHIDDEGYNVASAWTSAFMAAIRGMNLNGALGGVRGALAGGFASPGLSGLSVPSMAAASASVSGITATAAQVGANNVYNVSLVDKLEARNVDDIAYGLRRLGDAGVLPGSKR